jgi:hypothetical protein
VLSQIKSIIDKEEGITIEFKECKDMPQNPTASWFL